MKPPLRVLFWPNNSLITHIFFELCPIWYINRVANFGTHPLHNLFFFIFSDVDKILTFLFTYCIYTFHGMNLEKSGHFWTPLRKNDHFLNPSTQSNDYVIVEWSLIDGLFIGTGFEYIYVKIWGPPAPCSPNGLAMCV